MELPCKHSMSCPPRKGPGGRPVSPKLHRDTVTLICNPNGSIQVNLTPGNFIKACKLKEFIDRNISPDSKTVASNSQCTLDNCPVLGICSVTLTRTQYIDIARIIYPHTRSGMYIGKTSTQNFAKMLCELALNSDPSTSRLGTYTLIFDTTRFDGTAYRLGPRSRLRGGRPNCVFAVSWVAEDCDWGKELFSGAMPQARFLWNKMRRRQDSSNKMRRRQDFLTKSSWVLFLLMQ